MAESVRVNVNQEDSSIFSYLLMKVSLSHFEKPLSALDAGEQQAARKIAVKEDRVQELILTSPEASSTVVPDTVIDESVAQIRSRYEEEDEFLRDMHNNGISPDGLRTALERELRVEAILDKVASRAADVSDIDIQLYYYLHYEKLSKPERRTVRHILVTINEEMEDNTRERALARIEAVRNRVIKNPSRFEQQAMQYSECPSSLHGGLVGTVPRGQLFPSLDEVLFTMKQGEISSITESEMGFHVLYCEAVESGRKMSLQELKPQIRSKLEEKQRKRCQGAWLKNLIKGTGDSNDE